MDCGSGKKYTRLQKEPIAHGLVYPGNKEIDIHWLVMVVSELAISTTDTSQHAK